MSRWDSIGLFWQDVEQKRGGPRILGPIPPWDDTGWRPPTDFPNIQHAKAIALDCETYDPHLDAKGPGWARNDGHVVGVSLAVDGAKWYYPIRHTVEAHLNMDATQVLKWVDWALSGSGVKIGANIIYDIGWLQHEGVFVKGPIYDAQIAESLLDETARVSLDKLGVKYLGSGKTSEVLENWARNYYGTNKTKWRKDIYRCPVSLVGPYAEDDAAMPFEILKLQWAELEKYDLLELFEMECGLIPLLVEMRYAGVSIDLNKAEQLREKLAKDEIELQKQIDYVAGQSVQIGSGNSLASAFDKLGISYPRTAPTNKAPDGNPSFVKEFLEKHTHKFPQLITKLRGKEKLRGTFIEGYLLDSHVSGKVHGQFHLTKSEEGGARTGRFASSLPNLQNIPIRTEEGRKIRECFIKDYGHEAWRKYDLSQIEYRMLAHFATGEGAKALRKEYNDNPDTDYHDRTQALVLRMIGLLIERKPIKNVNFGSIYGVGIAQMAIMLGISVKKAKELLKAYHEAAPYVKATMEAMAEEAQRTGIITTILGRRSHFDLWESSNFMDKGMARSFHAAMDKWGSDIMRAYTYRAINYRIQGSAADQMKKTMYRCYKEGIFAETGVPRLTVHDELDFSDPGGKNKAFIEMNHIMETSIPLLVPVKADLEISDSSWGEVVSLEKYNGIIS